MSEEASPLPVSVIIPIRNGAPLLKFQLEALAAQDFDGDWETVVADNGSTDELSAVIAEYTDRLPDLRVVDASGRIGASHARNVGVVASRGEHLLFVDADDVAGPTFVRAMHEALHRVPFVAARLDPGPLNPGARAELDAAAQVSELNHAYAFLPWCGAICGIRRDAFAVTGGFDEDMLVGEDTDFSWRAQMAGLQLEFVADAVVQIRHRRGLKVCFDRGRLYGSAGPQLYRRYRSQGMPRRGRRAVVRFYGGLLKRVLLIRTRADLEMWLFLAGNRVGLIAGCIRYRVLYL